MNTKQSTPIALCITLMLAACGGAEAPVEQKETAPAVAYAVYGDTITAEGAMTMGDLMKAVEGKDSLDAKVSVDILASCAKKGCWMTVKSPKGDDMMIRFRDYGFFVPTEGLEGKGGIVQGRVKREVTDVAMLRHYAEDAGKSAEEIAKITEPDTSWTFLADGVLIRQ